MIFDLLYYLLVEAYATGGFLFLRHVDKCLQLCTTFQIYLKYLKFDSKSAKYMPRKFETSRGLTNQQMLFCEAYVRQAPLFNARQAAIRAGYSPTSAGTIGPELLIKEPVKEYIEELRKNAALRNHITLDDIINELAAIAFFDPARLYDEKGNVIDIHKLDPIITRAIGTIEREEVSDWTGKETVTWRVKPLDKIAAMQLLMECLGYKHKGVMVKRDATGKIIETEETETGRQIGDSKVIFEDYSENANPSDIQIQ